MRHSKIRSSQSLWTRFVALGLPQLPISRDKESGLLVSQSNKCINYLPSLKWCHRWLTWPTVTRALREGRKESTNKHTSLGKMAKGSPIPASSITIFSWKVKTEIEKTYQLRLCSMVNLKERRGWLKYLSTTLPFRLKKYTPKLRMARQFSCYIFQENWFWKPFHYISIISGS